MNSKIIALLAITTVGLAGCGGPSDDATVPPGELPDNVATGAMNNVAAVSGATTALLQTADGRAAGTARIEPVDGALRVTLAVEGLPPGERGVHIHMVGRCDGPSFESAGSHWNPTGAQHGLENPQGQHAGDMPNLTVGADGRGTLDYTLKGGTIAELLDADGASFIVHETVDDQRTDPTGNSGGRVACGVFSQS